MHESLSEIPKAHAYPVRFSSEHLIKATAKLRGMTETETRELLAKMFEENAGSVFASLVDFLCAAFMGH